MSKHSGSQNGGWQAGPGGGWSNWQAGPQYGGQQHYGAGPQAGPQRRIDALDVLEGMLQDGLSLSNITRIARASGSRFWLGAAIGAGVVVFLNRSDVRATVSGALNRTRAPKDPGDAPR